MCDLRNYPKKFIEDFILLYKNMPCLWKINSKAYSNKLLKKSAYEKLVEKLQEIEPNANKDMVVTKINSLRTGFRRELKKVKKSKATDPDHLYEPHLWYFDLLLFTSNQDGKTNIDDFKMDVPSESEFTNTVFEQNESNISTEMFVSKKREIDLTNNIPNEHVILQKICEAPTQSDDHFISFGNNVAQQLKTMNKKQQIMAKKMINEILFFGEMDQITLEATAQFGDFIQNVREDYCQ